MLKTKVTKDVFSVFFSLRPSLAEVQGPPQARQPMVFHLQGQRPAPAGVPSLVASWQMKTEPFYPFEVVKVGCFMCLVTSMDQLGGAGSDTGLQCK